MSFKTYCLLFFSILIVASCKDTSVETDNIFKFRDYISYTTSGVVSVGRPIQIRLAKPVASWKVGQELAKDLVTIKPYVEGVLMVENDHSLVFKPSENLEPDTAYTVAVKLKAIYDTVPDGFEDYTFQFKTITPSFNVTMGSLQSYSKSWQYLEGVIKSADVISIQEVKQLVTASQDGKQLALVFNEADTEAQHFEFKIDSIHRVIDDTNIKVVWQGKAIGADNAGENKVTIPGINNFTIVDTEVVQAPEQYLSINFSDPLKKQQNFDGLVSVQNAKHPKFIVDGNVLRVYPDQKLVGNIQVDLFQGIKNAEGYKLKTPFSERIAFEALKPEVKLISNGTILPNSKALRFNFKAVNLSAVDVRIIKIYEDNVLQFLQDNALSSTNSYAIKQVGRRIAKKTIPLQTAAENTGKWKAYSIDLSHFFSADPGAIYSIELTYNKSYALYDCEANSSASETTWSRSEYDAYDDTDTAEPSAEADDLREARYWDNQLYRYKRYVYDWEEAENPCHDAYYNESKEVSQNVLASNIGVIAKRSANNSYYFAVTDILTTAPIANAKVTLYNYQQQELIHKSTDTEGLITIDAEADAYANFAIVSKGNHKTYVKLEDGNALSLSKFDVSGSRLQSGLKGYLYGERGVWRPGDTLHLTFMLNDNANPLPKQHPVKLALKDPNGKLVYKNVSSSHLDHFYKFTVPTTTESKTGRYTAQVTVGGATFDKVLKIETVKPNRLKLKVDFEDAVLTQGTPLKGRLDVKWLHGAPGKHLKAEVKAKFSTAQTAFKSYKNYTFQDPTRSFKTEAITVFEGKVDANGTAPIVKPLHIGKNAPGMLKVQFLARAFENGGDFSIDAFTKTYAPYRSFVGLQSPKGNAYGSFFTDTTQNFDVVVLNANGTPVQRNGLEVKVYRVEWRWWWNSSYDDLASYVSSSYHRPYQSLKINTNAKGKGHFKLTVPDEDRGRYLIRVVDPVSGHATGRTAYFYKNWWQKAPSSDKSAAKMLVFSADKTTYNVGETAKITFASGNEGRALVSVENGTEVLTYTWKETRQGETTVMLPITKEMAPNVFVNIALLQPHAISANDLPLRLYGVIPLMVENPETKLHPELDMPDTLRPEQTFTLNVSEKNDKPMTYTVAVVEEGLLDLTRFKTPDAWFAFYKREALGVKTWDVFDDVIGAYSGSIDQVFAIGGDGNASEGKAKKANRFKPVVRYLGPFTLKAGATQKHKITLPNYIGAVRAMVVAGANTNQAYGSIDKTVPVKKPLMVLASLPRKLSPGEKVTLPVTVFAMEAKVKDVTLNLKLSPGIAVVGAGNKTLHFNQPEEQMAYFELDVSKAKGVHTVEIIAKGNGETSRYKVELDVVNTNPVTSKVIAKTLAPNSSATFNVSTFGITGTNAATLTFSTLPPMDFTRRMNYLIQYPHGCVEQTTSSVFPQLFLADIFDLTYDKKQSIQKHVENGIKRLGHFQRPEGGLSYWMGERSADDWGTSYAGHFMLEAEQKGYVLPLSFKSNWLRYQKQAARDWRPSYRQGHSDLAQAYRLYTLALAGQPDLASMNRLREFSEISNEAKWRLAAAYALAGQKEASTQVSQSANINFKPQRYNYHTYGSVDRNRAMALETMVLTKNTKRRALAETIAKDLSSKRWMSTQTTAYSLLAMAKMVTANGGKALAVRYSINGKNAEVATKNAIAQRDLSILDGENSITLKNTKANVVYVRVLNSGKLPLGEELVVQRGLSVTVQYKDLKGNTLDVSQLLQGQDFMATVKVSNLKANPVNGLALTEVFPSGWEIVNTRFTAFGNTAVSQSRHTDIRDDRVNFYFDLPAKGTNSTKTFNVMLNASYLGTYYLPGIQAEAMYDDTFLVRTKGQWVSVSK